MISCTLKYIIINLDHSMDAKPKKLLDQVLEIMRIRHYSYRTEQSYVDWIRRYILFHDKRHPLEMGGSEIKQFITYLATERNVAVSIQNQALSALLFLYRHVLEQEIEALDRPNEQGHTPPLPG